MRQRKAIDILLIIHPQRSFVHLFVCAHTYICDDNLFADILSWIWMCDEDDDGKVKPIKIIIFIYIWTHRFKCRLVAILYVDICNMLGGVIFIFASYHFSIQHWNTHEIFQNSNMKRKKSFLYIFERIWQTKGNMWYNNSTYITWHLSCNLLVSITKKKYCEKRLIFVLSAFMRCVEFRLHKIQKKKTSCYSNKFQVYIFLFSACHLSHGVCSLFLLNCTTPFGFKLHSSRYAWDKWAFHFPFNTQITV